MNTKPLIVNCVMLKSFVFNIPKFHTGYSLKKQRLRKLGDRNLFDNPMTAKPCGDITIFYVNITEMFGTFDSEMNTQVIFGYEVVIRNTTKPRQGVTVLVAVLVSVLVAIAVLILRITSLKDYFLESNRDQDYD